ncbi:MAG: alpha/beta fold hydrolase [Ignavibacteriales bacterium]|nr:alpha/beta fold hydrolase [Ignavibacteriales bacterium]
MKAAINNVLLRYVDIGIPNATPVIFIHGFPFSHRMWMFPGGQTEVLSGTNRVIAYDVRGHGESEVGTGHYSIEFFVDDLIALMDHLAIHKAILCGLSMGGYIALRFSERHPERVLGLILCDTKSRQTIGCRQTDPKPHRTYRSPVDLRIAACVGIANRYDCMAAEHQMPDIDHGG